MPVRQSEDPRNPLWAIYGQALSVVSLIGSVFATLKAPYVGPHDPNRYALFSADPTVAAVMGLAAFITAGIAIVLTISFLARGRKGAFLLLLVGPILAVAYSIIVLIGLLPHLM